MDTMGNQHETLPDAGVEPDDDAALRDEAIDALCLIADRIDMNNDDVELGFSSLGEAHARNTRYLENAERIGGVLKEAGELKDDAEFHLNRARAAAYEQGVALAALTAMPREQVAVLTSRPRSTHARRRRRTFSRSRSSGSSVDGPERPAALAAYTFAGAS
jgi:hypothetical protein